MKNTVLEITVFITGACCMILEIIGARMLAPMVGTSTTVWSAVIGIVLGSMAIGNYVGGKISDRKNSYSTLGSILLYCGISIIAALLVHLFLSRIIVLYINNIYVAAIVLSILLLSVPAVFFGMVTPFAARHSMSDIDSSGKSIGRIYAISTVGSIIGTFLGGFVLISFFKTRTIFLGVATILLCLSRIYGKRSLFFVIFSICCMLFFGIANNDRFVESVYNVMQIIDAEEQDRPVRYLVTGNGSLQSGMYLDKPNELLFDYTKYYLLGLDFFPEAESVVVIGGGAYSVPKKFLELKKKVTVVEIDPKLTEIAQKFFSLPDDENLTIINEDARVFMNKTKNTYDIVCLDVFTESIVPFHVATVEAAERLKALSNSAVIINVISAIEGNDGRLAQGIIKAFSQVFPEIQVYLVKENNPIEIQNIIIIASKKKLSDTPVNDILYTKLAPTRYKGSLALPIEPLQDDYAPVELFTSAFPQRDFTRR